MVLFNLLVRFIFGTIKKSIKMIEENGTAVDAKIVPNSREFKILGFDEWSSALKIKVKSAPEKGKANKELVERLQEMLKTKVKILQGEKSSEKKLWIENYSRQKLLDALKKPLNQKP